MVKLISFSLVSVLLFGCNSSSSEELIPIRDVTTLHLKLKQEFSRGGLECVYLGPLGYSGRLGPGNKDLTSWVMSRDGKVIATFELQTPNAKAPNHSINSVTYGSYLLYFNPSVIQDVEGNRIEIEKILKRLSEHEYED